MYETLHCIALRTVRYSDTRNLLTAYSRERGFVSLAIPAGTGREATRRRALTMPLALFEGVSNAKPGQEVLFVRDLRPTPHAGHFSADASKVAVALFLAEFYERLLRNSGPDSLLWDAVAHTVATLATANARAVANFAPWAVYRMLRPLGIEPDAGQWHPGAVFDLQAAQWRLTPSSSALCLTGPQAKGAHIVSRLTADNIMRLRLPRDDRRQMLDGLIAYIEMHYCALRPLRALEIVRELF